MEVEILTVTDFTSVQYKEMAECAKALGITAEELIRRAVAWYSDCVATRGGR